MSDIVLSLPVDGGSFQKYDEKKITKECPQRPIITATGGETYANRCFAEDKNYIYARKPDENLHYVLMRIRKK